MSLLINGDLGIEAGNTYNLDVCTFIFLGPSHWACVGGGGTQTYNLFLRKSVLFFAANLPWFIPR